MKLYKSSSSPIKRTKCAQGAKHSHLPHFRDKTHRKKHRYLLKQPLQSSLETPRSLPFSFLQSKKELSFYSTQAQNQLQEGTTHAQQRVRVCLCWGCSGLWLFPKWDSSFPVDGGEARNGGKKKFFFFFKARVGVLEVLRKLAWVLQNYSEGKVPELSPLRGRLSAPREGRRLSRRRRRSGSAGRGAPNGGGQGAAPGRSRRRDGEEAAGVPRQGEALPQARGPRAAGEAGRGAGAPSISGRSGTASRSLCLSQAHTGTHTHPASPAAAARPPALTCISLTNHLMAASGAGRLGRPGAGVGEDAARDAPERAGRGGGGKPAGGRRRLQS